MKEIRVTYRTIKALNDKGITTINRNNEEFFGVYKCRVIWYDEYTQDSVEVEVIRAYTKGDIKIRKLKHFILKTL